MPSTTPATDAAGAAAPHTADASAPPRGEASAAGRTAERPPLRRPRDCAVSGVSAGLARHLGRPVWLVRAAFVALTLVGLGGALLYAWLWVFVPWEEPSRDAPGAREAEGARVSDEPSRSAPVAWILTGASAAAVLLTVAGIVLFGANGVVWSSLPVWVGGVVASTGLAVSAGAWATLVDRRDPARGPRHENVVRLVVTAALVVLLLAQLSALRQTGVAGFLFALVPIAGIVLVYSSILVDRWRELTGERIRRIREEQRAEMAAHLHDSVLQTLALIQNRAGASSEVARLARAQERELRAWLYDGDAPADSDLATDLRDYAAALELDYPVRIDVVSAGLPAERASGEVAAASREAMLNAARHAGGDVSVYIEGNASAVDVYVRDRGPGFDLEDIPDDRLGIRQSILGRMRRAGGTATVRRGAGGGTEVHLRFAATPASPPPPSAGARAATADTTREGRRG